MRQRGRVDYNQHEIVAALRLVGCSVESLAPVGNGVPDLLVGRGGRNFLLEVKDGGKSPSRIRLTRDQVAWHREWRGKVYVVSSVDEALAAVGVTAGAVGVPSNPAGSQATRDSAAPAAEKEG
jgi:hypothetical protein